MVFVIKLFFPPGNSVNGSNAPSTSTVIFNADNTWSTVGLFKLACADASNDYSAATFVYGSTSSEMVLINPAGCIGSSNGAGVAVCTKS